MTSSSIRWDLIRADYEAGESLRSIARTHGISKTYLIERRNKEKWNRPEPTTERPPDRQEIPNRDINAAGRSVLALHLRAKKLTYEDIASRTGYGSASACRKAIMRELQRVVAENVNELRREELMVLDALHTECWEMAFDKSNKYRTFAMDRLLAISKRRSELMGLDKKPEEDDNTNLLVIQEIPAGWLVPVSEALP